MFIKIDLVILCNIFPITCPIIQNFDRKSLIFVPRSKVWNPKVQKFDWINNVRDNEVWTSPCTLQTPMEYR